MKHFMVSYKYKNNFLQERCGTISINVPTDTIEVFDYILDEVNDHIKDSCTISEKVDFSTIVALWEITDKGVFQCPVKS